MPLADAAGSLPIAAGLDLLSDIKYRLVPPQPAVSHHTVVGSSDIAAGPGGKWKARRAAEIALARLGRGGAGGRLTLRCRAPERLGLGSSTSDAVAAIRAVANAFGARVSAEEISAIAVEAEPESATNRARSKNSARQAAGKPPVKSTLFFILSPRS